ncbi:hypothetical protein SARC_13858, partial [Sphaeroforma arctica JP610]
LLADNLQSVYAQMGLSYFGDEFLNTNRHRAEELRLMNPNGQMSDLDIAYGKLTELK